MFEPSLTGPSFVEGGRRSDVVDRHVGAVLVALAAVVVTHLALDDDGAVVRGRAGVAGRGAVGGPVAGAALEAVLVRVGRARIDDVGEGEVDVRALVDGAVGALKVAEGATLLTVTSALYSTLSPPSSSRTWPLTMTVPLSVVGQAWLAEAP